MGEKLTAKAFGSDGDGDDDDEVRVSQRSRV